ncbi:NAD(P)/FAD-dependent oxidoreductase [Geodermatophilus sp. Leaf369]|uniref:NAD(P)/FAD-dependent oxidoreductase n=1 Tax=Geodermatophilus sp. Leaf369 TaxID=1736354 RepID=UPI0009EBC592|nr:FAD-dependent oxidoreductase [Geodermatophilus sp. Leaf369]
MQRDYDYLVIGAGMAADSAARGIRELDPDGSIGIVGEEVDPPVARPSLSKKLWTDPEFTLEQSWLGTEETGAALHTATRIRSVDRAARTATTEDGDVFGYRRLLLATGGHPKQLDLPDDSRIVHFRTMEDFRRLQGLAGEQRHVAVVGGGYIGTELAAALVQNDTRVTFVFPQEFVGGASYPHALAEQLSETYAARGVQLRPGTRVTGGTADAHGVHLTLDDGSTLDVDGVAVGLGISPATTLAEDAGLTVTDGVEVDAFGRTEDPDVYAAGDVANWPDPILGRTRVEHVENATDMGTAVGKVMAADTLGRDAEPYTHTPSFYSDLFDAGYEAVGTLDASLDLVTDWATPPGTGEEAAGVVYYLEGDRLRGVLLWNVWDSTDAARELLAAERGYTADDLVGAIPTS